MYKGPYQCVLLVKEVKSHSITAFPKMNIVRLSLHMWWQSRDIYIYYRIYPILNEDIHVPVRGVNDVFVVLGSSDEEKEVEEG